MVKYFFKTNYLSIIFGLITIAVLYFISLYSYVLYHSIVEIFSIVIAFVIFIIAWNSKKFLDNNYLLFVGIAFFFVSSLDLLHTLAYKGMGIFISFTESNLATQLWISTRYFESISLLLAIFFIKRKLNYKIQLTCYLTAAALILLSIFYWRIFPVCFVEGSGLTAFKVASEYIISFLLAAAIFFLYLYRKNFNRKVFMLIIASMVVSILTELSFTLYTDVYGLLNQLGHFFEFLSFFLIYKAIIETGFSQPLDLLFFKLQQSKKEIRESEEKFRLLYSSMDEGVCLYETIYDELKKPIDYKIIDVNNAYQSILGFQRNQVIGRKASEIYRTDIALYRSVYAQVTNSGKSTRFETYFSPMKKYLLISVISPSKGKLATIFSDITERKKNENEIESLSRFPSENPNPVMRINNKNSIIYTNEPAKIILQQLSDDEKSKFLKLLPDQASGLEKNKNNKLKIIEFKIGKLIFEFTFIPIKDFNYFNIYGRNVTARKEAERFRNKIRTEKILNEERNKVARELHDTVTQTLFSANLIAETIPKLWRKEPKVAIESLEKVKHLNSAALMEMRAILYELRPSALKDEDLGNLLLMLSKSLEARSKISIELTIRGEYKFPPKIELGYYRIAQEALNNIVKHSHATKASIVLEVLPEKLYMDISDNGRGFNDKIITSANLGLTIMRERAKLIGASIAIDNLPGKGTRITVIYIKKQTKKPGHK
ncbi:MAG: MASE3 domain-containing protein [Candidatus Humimicrobiaceae bacterium]